jgi:tripartite-type tricarboxylate transporter receptor subunit TctC
MIRYVISFPVEADIRPEQMRYLTEVFKEAADSREWRDFVINQGGTITDMRRQRSVSSLVRRARSKVR